MCFLAPIFKKVMRNVHLYDHHSRKPRLVTFTIQHPIAPASWPTFRYQTPHYHDPWQLNLPQYNPVPIYQIPGAAAGSTYGSYTIYPTVNRSTKHTTPPTTTNSCPVAGANVNPSGLSTVVPRWSRRGKHAYFTPSFGARVHPTRTPHNARRPQLKGRVGILKS
jgi:hypothetical protein